MYTVFFVVVGFAAYAFLSGAAAPSVSIDGESYSQGEEVTIDSQTYTVGEITAESSSGGGHGGGGGETVTSKLTWTNNSVQKTATLENNSTVQYQNETWRVLIANQSDVSTATLQQEHNVSAALAADSAVENESVQYRGAPHVVYRANQTLVPLSEYLPEPETTTLSAGDSYPYEGQTTTVDSVAPAGVTLVWTTTEDNEKELEDGANVTLQGRTYLAHFPSENEVVLSQDFDGYQNSLDRQHAFHERKNGLWGISILSFFTAILLISAAYLPNRG
jgi:hypothetical protein